MPADTSEQGCVSRSVHRAAISSARVPTEAAQGVPRAAAQRETRGQMPFSAVEDAIAAIGRGEIVVVVDDEDRENEGDLIMAADAVTPEKIAFFLAHTSGLICVPLTPERVEHLDLPADGDHQHRGPADGVHRERGLPARDLDGDLGRRPGRHHQGAGRSPHPSLGPQPARPHLPAPLPTRWGAEAGRPHRGRRRPGPGGGHVAGRRAVRGGQRGQDGDGPAARAAAVRRKARTAPDLHRRPHPVPPAQGQARAPDRRRPDPHRLRRVHRLRLRVGARRRTPRGPGQRGGRRPAPTPWSGCTASA